MMMLVLIQANKVSSLALKTEDITSVVSSTLLKEDVTVKSCVSNNFLGANTTPVISIKISFSGTLCTHNMAAWNKCDTDLPPFADMA